MSGEHSHEHDDQAHAHGRQITGLDWLMIGAGVGVFLVVAEWAFGAWLRERTAAQAQAWLAAVRSAGYPWPAKE